MSAATRPTPSAPNPKRRSGRSGCKQVAIVLGVVLLAGIVLILRHAPSAATEDPAPAPLPAAAETPHVEGEARVRVGPTHRPADLTEARGWSVHGEVRDAATRAPVVTTLRAYPRPERGRSQAIGPDVTSGSGADATFRFDHAFTSGRYWLAAAGGLRIVAGNEFVVEEREPPPRLLVLVAAGDDDSITGRVLDAADRRPLADVVVQGRGEGLVTAYSDADGHFCLFAPAPARGPVALSIDECWRNRPRQGFPYQLDHGPVLTEWGARDVEILLRRASPFTLRVTDETGAPVEEFGAAVVAIGGNGGGGLPLLIGRHAGGSRTFDFVADDQLYVALVVPGRRDLFPSPPLRIERTGGLPHEMSVRLARRREVVARCVDARGQGVADVLVNVLAHLPYRFHTPSLPGLPIEGLQEVTCATLELASGTTGSDGRVALRVPVPTPGLVWRLEGPGATFHAHAGADLIERGGEVVFVIHDGGTLRVRAGSGVDPTVLSVSLLSDTAPARASAVRLPVATRTPWTFDADGTATVTRIPEGTWHVELVGLEVDPVRLGTIAVRSGSVHDLSLDAARLRRETVRGRVECDGAPCADLAISAHLLSGGGAFEATTDERGEFRLDDVPHGELRVQGDVRGGGGRGSLPLGSLHVGPGGVIDASFKIHRLHRVVRLVDARGRPLSHLEVVALDAGDREGWRAVSDADGFVTLDWLPTDGRIVTLPGDWHVRKWTLPDDGRATPWRPVIDVRSLMELPPRADLIVK